MSFQPIFESDALILTMDNIKIHNPVLTIGDNIPNVPGEDFYVQHLPVVHR